jgi:3-hydroxy-9,10-secoandrosta-1,3,5(10)-triene-9,17-dione monooxygenase
LSTQTAAAEEAAIPTPEEMVRRARELAPVLKERAQKTAELRRLPEETMADLHDGGFFKIVQPARYGGYELTPLTLFEVQIELGAGCPSTAWVTGVLGVHSWQMALFPEEAQEEAWGDDPSVLISSSYAPVGKIKRVDGGYRVSGRWSFSSGCDYSDWVFLGGFVPPEGEGGRPDMRTFMIPRADYQIVDNWHVAGLKGSGSKDVVVEDAFVPDHRTHRLIDGFKLDSPGNAVNTSPVYRLPFGQIHVRSVSSPAVGAAFGALNQYVDVAAQRVAQSEGTRVAEDPTSQVVAAEAEATLDSIRLVLRRNFEDMMSLAEAAAPGEAPEIPLDRRVRYRFHSAQAVDSAMRATDRLMTASGGRAIFLSNPIQTYYQDIHAIRAHYANNPEKPARNLGRTMLGMKNQDFFI